MFLDLDKFKPVNDNYGHSVGDLLLQEVAHRIEACVRESNTVARMGGDEFVVLLRTTAQAADALAVAEKTWGLPSELPSLREGQIDASNLGTISPHLVTRKIPCRSCTASIFRKNFLFWA